MKVIINSVRKHSIAIYHTDIPLNDYNILINTIHNNKESYMTLSSPDSPILPFATATSFYQQVLASSSLHLGFSSAAVHWLSRRPCDIRDFYIHRSQNETELALWRDQAAEDWNNFLHFRSKELVPGGSLVLNILCIDENGNYTSKGLSTAISQVIEEMIQNKQLTDDERKNINPSMYFRTREEIIGPLSSHNLTLHHSTLSRIQNPIYLKYKSRGGNEREGWNEYGKDMADWIKGWLDASLRRGITNEDVIKYFYQRLAEVIAANPHLSAHGCVFQAVITKNTP